MATFQKILSVVIVIAVFLFAVQMCKLVFPNKNTEDAAKAYTYNYLKEHLGQDVIVNFTKVNQGDEGWSIEGRVRKYNGQSFDEQEFVIALEYSKRYPDKYEVVIGSIDESVFMK